MVMKEEELIKKLKNVELPDIKLQSHQSRLKMALLDAGYPQKQRGGAFWELAKSKLKGAKDTMIKGLISRQPVWKTVTFGILALALVLGLTLTIPSLTAESVYAQAKEIVQNSPEVQAALGADGEVQIIEIEMVDGTGTVIAQCGTGIVSAAVDLDAKRVTEVVTLIELTEADKQEAIDIAKADPRVKELLDSGATIGEISTMYISGAMGNVATGEIEEFSEALVMIDIVAGEKTYVAQIDLAEGKVVRLLETFFAAGEAPGEPGCYFVTDSYATGEEN
jgi:hypothetical protein